MLVCGDDGLTYSSRCIAECQGVTVAGDGPCSAAAAAKAAADLLAEATGGDAGLSVGARLNRRGAQRRAPSARARVTALLLPA